MKLRLNVATAPQENHRPFLAGAALIGVIALIALLVLSHRTLVIWRSNQQMRADTAQLQRQIQIEQAQQQELDAYFRTTQAQQILARADFLNSLITERSFPWTRIFMDLEKTLPPGVRVISISPKLVDGRVQVQMAVGASSDQSKIEFLEAMEKSPNFSDVSVSDEHPGDEVGQEIKVSLSFNYATT